MDKKKFAKYHGQDIGFLGNMIKIRSVKQIANILDKKIKSNCKIWGFGKKKIKKVGIVSGGGSMALPDAVKEKVDCFILGEAFHHTALSAKEAKMNVIIAGHYATETVGVKALMPLVKEKFNIATIFIDNPTDM